jgi:hypothetical protein
MGTISEACPMPTDPEPRPLPRTLDTHNISGRQFIGLATSPQPRQATPILREAEETGNTLPGDVEPQLLTELGGDDRLHHEHL